MVGEHQTLFRKVPLSLDPKSSHLIFKVSLSLLCLTVCLRYILCQSDSLFTHSVTSIVGHQELRERGERERREMEKEKERERERGEREGEREKCYSIMKTIPLIFFFLSLSTNTASVCFQFITTYVVYFYCQCALSLSPFSYFSLFPR